MPVPKTYHHGNLRRALIDEAVNVIAENGVAALSLRDLARRLGVSHAAPAHHFAEKRDLLTAIAAEGFDLLSEALAGAGQASFLEAGVAYARFALQHPVHLQLMFQPSLLRPDDPGLEAASSRTLGMLYGSASEVSPDNRHLVGMAGWCLMHGFASLWLSGNLRNVSDEPLEAARLIAATAFKQS